MKTIQFFISMILITACVSALSESDYSAYSAVYSGKQLIKCCLSHEISINNIPCHNWLRFYENGTLKQCEAARDTEIQNMVIPKYTVVFFRPDGTIEKCWFSRNVTIQGVLCKGNRMKSSTSFHKNGKLKCCFLADNQQIQGIPCRSSSFQYVEFYENGALMRCPLSDTYTKNGKEYKKGTTLILDAFGNVTDTERETFMGIDIFSLFE